MKRKTMFKYALVLGTRPEIIKLSPLIRLFQRLHRRFVLIHTGQHYSYEMDKLFFKELALPIPHHHLSLPAKVMGRQADHTGRMMASLESVLINESPDIVFVQGDTNTVLAASLVVAKIHGMKLAHIEAGLRSYDRAMPEEVNRVLSDHVSDYLFAPTIGSRRILLKEGLDAKKVYVTGNTIVDAVRQNLDIARRKRDAVKKYGLKMKCYFLLTLHRQENVDDLKRFTSILRGLSEVHSIYKLPIYFPMHPRTRRRLEEFKLALPKGVVEAQPVGFLDFLQLEAGAKLILTDSGGVQEEACILGVPSVTLRTTTERPETLVVRSSVLAGYDPKRIVKGVRMMLARKKVWRNPFGDGRASESILNILETKIT